MSFRLLKSLWPERYLPESTISPSFEKDSPRALSNKVGVLMVNLGTPDAPITKDIRRYLSEFLSDTRVIELPRYLWWPILQAIVLFRRPKKLEPRYRSIWLNEGSPLLVWSQRQAAGVQDLFNQKGLNIQVKLAMRYGKPSMVKALMHLRNLKCQRILILPLYPQYAASTTASVVDAVMQYTRRLRNQPELRFIKSFYNDSHYIAALAENIQSFWRVNDLPEKLVISFHGLPCKVIEKGDPYYSECLETANLLRQQLNLTNDQVQVTFQSRFGLARWLEPYTEPTLKMLAQQGTTKIDVVCPGFMADCLETLEEIAQECQHTFLKAGGKRFRYIPALNAQPAGIRFLSTLIERHVQGWLE